MGNEMSSAADVGGRKLQLQDSDLLWTITHYEEEESELEEEVCAFTHGPGNGDQADLCRAGVEHLRLLRHPNILKFLSCDMSHDHIGMVTEPVVPLCKILEEACVEGMVIGWRGVSEGLTFLHEKAGISHNNLSGECVYVSTVTSQWKIGGFEAAQKHKNIDSQFLAKVAPFRHAKAIPPEDKARSPASPRGHVPCHSRDIWAFGGLILTILEDTALEGHVSESFFSYVQEEMLNSEPELRPTASDVLEQSWMSTDATEIAAFLSKLTMESKKEKDEFFDSLARRLYSLPPVMVAEYLIPLLLTPLVMAEPVAREKLWKHLLMPTSYSFPRPKVFDPSKACPLLDKELYISHVIPLLLNLLQCRDLHVRLVLLENISGFAPIIGREELIESVLPEVLVGLKELKDEIVQATLHALGDLVPLLGAEAVVGTHRNHIFVDSTPRSGGVSSPSACSTSSPAITSPPSRSTREETEGGQERVGGMVEDRQERLERMREKREEQRRKRMAQERKKLGGKVMDGSNFPLLAERETEKEKPLEENEGAGTGSDQTPSTSNEHPQYSPSVSHDEEEQWEAVEGGEFDKETSRTGKTERGSRPTDVSPGKMVSLKGLQGSSQAPSDDGKRPSSLRSPESTGSSDGNKLPDSLRGRLKDEDIQRLEVQAAWRSAEPDFFADMEPPIPSSTGSSIESGVGGRGAGKEKGEGLVAMGIEGEGGMSAPSVSLMYKPSGQDEVTEGGWEDNWNDFD